MSEEDITEEIRADFQDFMSKINIEKVNIENETLDDAEIVSLIDKVISFYDTVCRHSEPF